MRFYKVREEILKGKNIADSPLKVTFYAVFLLKAMNN